MPARGPWWCRAAFACGALILVPACAGSRGPGQAEQARLEGQVAELRAQVQQQADQLQQQQRHIDLLEQRLTALAAAPAPALPVALPAGRSAPAPAALPDEAPKKLQTVKLLPQSGRRPHERRNPVERAPRLPVTVALREPDEEALSQLDAPLPPAPRREQEVADRQYAEAVGLLNQGDWLSAQTSFLSFVARHPRHPEAGSAASYAALARAVSGDCPGALQQFERASRDYPRSATAQVLLSHGRCLLQAGRRDEARRRLGLLLDKFPGSTEATQADALLAGGP